MPQSTRIFRIFVSSTFSDLKTERNALQARASSFTFYLQGEPAR